MKAIKKPIPIEVIQVLPQTALPPFVNTRTSPVLAVWNDLHQSWIGFEYGDYLNITRQADVYPIARLTFEETYDVLLEG